MHISLLHLAVAAVSSPAFFLSLVSAQTFTDCNPLKETCPADPALAGLFEFTYSGSAAPDFSVTAGSDVISYDGSKGAVFRVEKKGDAPTLQSDFYIMWGHIEVSMQAAPGGGVVSSVVLQSDDLDEIDWEWIGSKPAEAQSNYFGKGNTGTFSNGATHAVDSQSGYHTYAVTWTEDSTQWLIDGTVVRTLTPAQAGSDYPQSPMRLRLGAWAAGDPSNAEGTVQWSGGPIDYTKGPYDMLVKSIKVQDYSTGSEYQYTDHSGSSDSIEAVNGQINAGPQTGAGNAGSLASSAAASSSTSGASISSAAGSSQGAQGSGSASKYDSPSNGLVVSATATATSKPSSNDNPGAPTDSAESTQTPSSPSGSPARFPSASAGGAETGAANGTVPFPIPIPTSVSSAGGFVVVTSSADLVTVTTTSTTGAGFGSSGSVPLASNGTAPTAPAQPSTAGPDGSGSTTSGSATAVETSNGALREAGSVRVGVVLAVAGMLVGWFL